MDCMRDNFDPGVLLDGRYRTVSPLNHGSFGMVFKAFDLFTNDFVALKCLTKNSAAIFCPSAIAIDEKSEELVVHKRIGNQANIVNLLHSFETANHVYLVLEFCSNGDLYEAIRVGRGPLQTEHVRDFMFQLIGAVEHMHKNGIYHRDIKPENIFLTQNGSMKLGDFGLATKDTWSHEAGVGSDRYMAPEQYDPAGNGYAPAKADIWSIGICLLNILFSRNPFATPTPSDPLYLDFVADRQTLFDVFPSLSQDTFGFLMHCLAIDPAMRSMSAAKEALKRIVSFTTDDEALDEFCTDERVVALATANREPLRTPSISTPHIDNGGAFLWAKALAMSPPQQFRQLSAIPDAEFSESLFPSSEDESKDWASSKPETSSIASFVDSGLGVSLKSSNTIPQTQGEPIKVQRTKPVPISGSLPISAARGSLADIFKRDTMSKSWSDMYEEDEEALASSDVENSTSFGLGTQLQTIKSKDWGYESDGRSTPRNRNRVGLTEMKNPASVNSRNGSPQTLPEQDVDEHISEHTGFVFEDHASPLTPTKGRKMDFLDKWAKLGARRRAEPEVKSATTSGSATPNQSTTATKREAGAVQTPRKRSQTRVGSWRGRRKDGWMQHGNGSDVWDGVRKEGNWTGTLKTGHDNSSSGGGGGGKEWSTSKDWRQHSPTQNRQHSYQHTGGRHWHDLGSAGPFGDTFEWVWRSDLHL